MANETRNAYGEELKKLVAERKDIVVLDADLSSSTRSGKAKEVDPKRHINAGIAECNMMGMAAGLAASGKTVFASSFAVFATGRPYEIIRNSICYPNLNVKICASHAGMAVGEDGASHQAIEDVGLMRILPNMKVYVPCDQYQAKAVVRHIASIEGPCYARFGRGKVDDFYNEKTKFNVDKIDVLNKGTKVVIFAMGLMVQEAMKALPTLQAKGINPTVVNVCCIKPIDEKGIMKLLKENDVAVVCEEHTIYGGLFTAISEIKSKTNNATPLVPIAVNDTFGESGKMLAVLEAYGLCASNIVNVVSKSFKKYKNK